MCGVVWGYYLVIILDEGFLYCIICVRLAHYRYIRRLTDLISGYSHLDNAGTGAVEFDNTGTRSAASTSTRAAGSDSVRAAGSVSADSNSVDYPLLPLSQGCVVSLNKYLQIFKNLIQTELA